MGTSYRERQIFHEAAGLPAGGKLDESSILELQQLICATLANQGNVHTLINCATRDLVVDSTLSVVEAEGVGDKSKTQCQRASVECECRTEPAGDDPNYLTDELCILVVNRWKRHL